MPRVKRGLRHLKRRKLLLKRVKGFEAGRKSLLKLAKTADTKAGAHAYRDRRVKKRVNRALWQVRINAAAHAFGLNYSQLINKLKKQKMALNRKVLSDIAMREPSLMEKIIHHLSTTPS